MQSDRSGRGSVRDVNKSLRLYSEHELVGDKETLDWAIG